MSYREVSTDCFCHEASYICFKFSKQLFVTIEVEEILLYNVIENIKEKS